MHGARRGGGGRVEERLDPRRAVVVVAGDGGGPQTALDERREEGGLVEALVGGFRHVGDQEQRRAFEGGVGDAVGRAGGARPDARDDDARRAAELGRDRRHQGAGGLAVDQHEGDALRGEGVDHVEAAAPARHAEGAAGAPRPQRRRQNLDEGPRHAGAAMGPGRRGP